VRHLGGADFGLKMRSKEQAPISSHPHAVSAAVGNEALVADRRHTDYRGRYHHRNVDYYGDKPARLAASPTASMRSPIAREELKGGRISQDHGHAGLVADRSDRLLGFSRDEILAAVEEARNPNLRAAHPIRQAIRRAAECGVLSIEAREPDQAGYRAVPAGKRGVSVRASDLRACAERVAGLPPTRSSGTRRYPRLFIRFACSIDRTAPSAPADRSSVIEMRRH